MSQNGAALGANGHDAVSDVVSGKAANGRAKRKGSRTSDVHAKVAVTAPPHAGERFRAMVESAPFNAMVIDLDLVIRYANPQSIATLGKLQAYIPIPVRELIGKSVDVFHKNPSHQRRILSDPANLPHTARIKLGPELLDMHVVALRDESGEHVGSMLSWSIATERAAAEAEIARVMSMMENLPFSVMYADRDLTIRYLNPASARTLGLLQQHLPVRVEDMVGSSIDIFHKNPSHQRRMLADASNLPHSARIKLGPETLQLNVSAVKDDKGAYVGSMLTWDVITERVETERKLAEASERERMQAAELNDKVDRILKVVTAAAGGDLTQQLDVTGEDAIGRMGEALQRFFGDLRGSLGAITGNASSLAAAGEELNAVSQQMSANAEETSTQAKVVSKLSGDVNDNLQTIAASTDEMTRPSARSPRTRATPCGSPPRP